MKQLHSIWATAGHGVSCIASSPATARAHIQTQSLCRTHSAPTLAGLTNEAHWQLWNLSYMWIYQFSFLTPWSCVLQRRVSQEVSTSCSYHQISLLFAANTHLCCFPITSTVAMPLNSGPCEIWWVLGFLNGAWADPCREEALRKHKWTDKCGGNSPGGMGFPHPRAFGRIL